MVWWDTRGELGEAPTSPLLCGYGWSRAQRARRKLRRLLAERFLGRLGSEGVRGLLEAPLGLCYHGVVERLSSADYDPHLMVSPAFLRHQLCVLRRVARVVPSGELREGERGQAVVTFDDALLGVWTLGAPILREQGVRASLFVNDGVWREGELWHDTVARAALSLERGAVEVWFDRLLAPSCLREVWRLGGAARSRALVVRCKQLDAGQLLERLRRLRGVLGGGEGRRYMSPGEVRAWDEAGHEVGGHTTYHPILTRLGAQEQRAEVSGNRAALEGLLGKGVRSFAYPNGDHDAALEALVRELGYEHTWATERRGGRALERCNMSDFVCMDEDGRFHGGLFLLWVWMPRYLGGWRGRVWRAPLGAAWA